MVPSNEIRIHGARRRDILRVELGRSAPATMIDGMSAGGRDGPAQPLVDGGWPSQRAARTQRVAAGRRPARRQQHATAIGAARRAPARARHPRAPAPAHAGPAPAVRRGPAGVARAGGAAAPAPRASAVHRADSAAGAGCPHPRRAWASAHPRTAGAVATGGARGRGCGACPGRTGRRSVPCRTAWGGWAAGSAGAPRGPAGCRRPSGHARAAATARAPAQRPRAQSGWSRARPARGTAPARVTPPVPCRRAGHPPPRAAPRPGWGSRSSGRSGAAQRAAADQPRGIHPRPRRQQILDLAQVAVHHALIERAQHVGAGMPAGQAIESGARTAGCSSRIRTGGR